jgi:tetratricopeptide (TPR) repeat protein
MCRLAAVALLAISCAFFPGPLTAFQAIHMSATPDEIFKIEGTVYFSGANQPADNVVVELRDTNGNEIEPAMTSGSGGFRFGGLRSGSYSIVIHADGYEPVNLLIDLSFQSERGIAIYLKPMSEKSSGVPNTVSVHELSMPSKARDWMKSGKKKLYIDKNAQGGLEDFQQAVSAAPGYYEAHYQIGIAYLALRKSDDAEKSFRTSVEMSEDKYGEAEIALGTLMLNRGDFVEGEKTIRQGVERSPDNWQGQYELGRALLEERQLTEAYKSATLARSLAPNAAIVYLLLSNIHWRARNFPALLDDLDVYLKLDPESATGARAKEFRDKVRAIIADSKSSNANAKP